MTQYERKMEIALPVRFIKILYSLGAVHKLCYAIEVGG